MRGESERDGGARGCDSGERGAVKSDARGRGILARVPLRALARDERGSASLEFITVGLLMLLPLIYLVLALGTIQGQALGVEAAARHAARVISLAHDERAATARTDAVLAGVAREYGIEAGALEVSVTCVPAASVCPIAGATVLVTVGTRVALPFVPSVLGLDRIASVPIAASAAQKVSRFWGGAP